MLQPKLLIKVLALLNENQIDYMITGSLVSSIQGEPRATHDVDILVNITQAAIPVLIKAFMPPDYYISEFAIEEAIQHKSMFNLLDTTEGDKVDFWILTDEPFDKSRFARKYEEVNPGMKNYSSLSTLDSLRGNYKDYYKNYRKSIVYRDSINYEDNTKKPVQLQMKYEFDKKESVAKA